MDKSISMQQVHGNNVIVVNKNDIGKIIPNCDGLITNDPEVTLVVETADCLPISITDKKDKVIALVHAGWRGLEKEILKVAINKLINEFGTRTSNLEILIGPHICQNCYEIKSDVAGFFKNVVTVKGKKYLNLENAAINQLTELGVLNKNIKVDKRCTFEDHKFPSYRRGDRNKRIITKLNI